MLKSTTRYDMASNAWNSKASADGYANSFKMSIQNNAGRTRPRGKQSPSHNLNPRRNHCFQLHLHFTVLVQTILAPLSCKSARCLRRYRALSQRERVSFVSCRSHSNRASDAVVSQLEGNSQSHIAFLSILSAYLSWAFTTCWVYRLVKDRLKEAKGSTVRDIKMEARNEALDFDVDENNTGASSSNLGLPADNFTQNARPSSMYRLGSFSTPDLGSTRTGDHQDRETFPRRARRGLFGRVTNPFSSRNRNGIDRSQIGSPMPIISENAINSVHTVADVRLVRNLELERQARLMGFELPQNRFGLPQEFGDNSGVYAENQARTPWVAETVIDHIASSRVIVSTDNASTINETERFTSYQGLVQNSPPYSPNVAMPEHEGGLNYQQRASRYSTSWLSNSFTSHNTEEFLHNFGSPPFISEFPPRSSSLTEMAQDNPQNVNNLGERETRGSDGPGAGRQPPVITRPTENDRLRDVVREIVNRFLARLSAKDAEIRDLNARTTTALEKVNFLEGYMEGHKAGLEEQKSLARSNGDSDYPVDNHGKSGFIPKSDSSTGGSNGGRSSHKKSTSKEGGFFKNLLGTTEPSHAALKKLKERSLAEANADEKDLGLAAKLKVSSRQLPPEAPKPASKEPVPIPKSFQRHLRSTGTLIGQSDTDITDSFNLLSRATPAGPDSLSGPERVSLDKSSPEMEPEEDEKDEGKKDGKKRGFRGLFSKK